MGGKQKTHRLRQALHRLRTVRTWQLVLILVPLLFFTATLLRFDHIRMSDLRAAVLAADEAGDDAKIQETLVALQKFVVSHVVINIIENNGNHSVIFGTGPFYLEHQYLRAANAAIKSAESELANDSNPHGNIYAAVAGICQPLAIANGWQWSSQGYLDCWTSELAKYPASDELDINLTADVPSTELYRYNFASPLWSPTPAGFALLTSVLIITVVIIRLVTWLILRIALIFVKKS